MAEALQDGAVPDAAAAAPRPVPAARGSERSDARDSDDHRAAGQAAETPRRGAVTGYSRTALARRGLERSTDDRLVAGVAGGLGRRVGVDPAVLRFALVALAFAGGAGVVLYLVAWAFTSERTSPAPPTAWSVTTRQSVALALMVLGALLLFRRVGLWFGDTLSWPLVALTAGSATLWVRGSDEDRARWARFAARVHVDPVDTILEGVAPVRLATGGILIAIGIGTVIASADSARVLAEVAAAVTVAVAGLVLVVGPWVNSLAQQLRDERRGRIRSEERAEMAAHLHDSVLQTLALIQRSAGDPRRTTALARRQERELRSWLFGGQRSVAHSTLRGAVEAIAAEVEADHDIAFETVVVGDAPVDDEVSALLGAAREAALNAARHAGVAEAALFVEVDDDRIEAYVRDRGRGFDVDDVAVDRRGIAESIVARMARHGGRAEIDSGPSRGTEVTLVLPRRRAVPTDDADGDRGRRP